MLGIYFSGTGNSRYALEVFLRKYDETALVCSIEETDIINYIKGNKDIVFSYSVQYSNIPKMLKDFVDRYQHLWQGKRVFVIATMGLFSGDGAGNERGISESNQASVFRRFYREEEVHDELGVGIGLYLAREIITLQGGYIKVTSQVHKGSTFSVFLPSR